MKTSLSYLDEAKKNAGISSDYALSKKLGVTPSAITNYRAGRSRIAPELVPKLAKLAGIDEAEIALIAQIERSKTAEEKGVWERILQRIGKSAVSYVMLAGIVTGTALNPDTARASQEAFTPLGSLHTTNYAKL